MEITQIKHINQFMSSIETFFKSKPLKSYWLALYQLTHLLPMTISLAPETINLILLSRG